MYLYKTTIFFKVVETTLSEVYKIILENYRNSYYINQIFCLKFVKFLFSTITFILLY